MKAWKPVILKAMTVLLALLILFVVVTGVRLVLLKRQVSTYREYWQTLRETSSKNRTYFALGDSSAQGIGASKPQNSYVGLIAQDSTFNVINLSVSGARVADVASQVSEMEKTGVDSDDLVTLTIGGNNMRQFDEANFEKEIVELFVRLPKQTVVGDIAYFGGGRFRKYEPNVIKANQIIHRVAAKHNLRVAKVYEITKERDSFWVYAVDLFHPSNTGYLNWYDAFRPEIVELL